MSGELENSLLVLENTPDKLSVMNMYYFYNEKSKINIILKMKLVYLNTEKAP